MSSPQDPSRTSTARPSTAQIATAEPTAAPGPVDIGASTAWRTIWQEASGLLRTAGALLARYWLLLLGIAALAAAAQHWITRLAVIASRQGAINGMLVFALVPGISFLAIVAMLALLARRPHLTERPRPSMLAVLASAMLVFLVLYEQNGQLTQDRKDYLYEATMEEVWSSVGDTVGGEAVDRIPDPVSLTVIAAIVIALVVRTVGSWILDRRARAAAAGLTPTPTRGSTVGNGLLRLLVTYSELVWLVFSVLAIVGATNSLGDWWSSRALVHSVSEAWADLQWPAIAPFIGAVSRFVGGVVALLIAGVFVPAAWLGLGLILFGRSRGTIEAIAIEQDTQPHRAPHRFTDLEQVARSWATLLRPSSRWGPLGGAAGLVLARGWLPLLTFAVLFTVLTQVDYVIWWLADLLLPTVAALDWRALYPVLWAFGTASVMVVTAVLVAAGTSRTLVGFGMPSPLRLPQTSKDQ